jgi:hypothetical protein
LDEEINKVPEIAEIMRIEEESNNVNKEVTKIE